MENVIIAGCAGFLGVNLAHRLLEDESVVVYGIDNFVSGDISLIYPLLKNDRYNFIEDNLENKISICANKVYFCAGIGDITRINDSIYENCLTQIKLVNNMLDYTQQTGAKTLFLRDFHSTYKNATLYAFEDFIQKLILTHQTEHKTNVKIARISDCYGANSSKRDKRFINNTIIKAYNNEPIEIKMNEEKYFSYVDDVILILKQIMDNYVDSNVVDISSNLSSNLVEVAKLIISYMNSKSKIILHSSEFLKSKINPNTSYLKENFNLECGTSVLSGIIKTVEYAKLMYFS